MTEGQQIFLEHAFAKFHAQDWLRLEKILGTFWEWTDLYGADGKPMESTESEGSDDELANSMRMPLASIMKPELLNLVRKKIRPPRHMRKDANIVEGSELDKKEFLSLFGSAIASVPQAAESIQESMKPFFTNPPPSRHKR